ncbi:MAG: copper-translocating P-type ATPase [Candidatus Riflebacteria bacterium]|nr:copper-translocating P-type ATPase [Candidatus Riflebacteria bacterium]
MKQQKFTITGMSCAGCAANVEKTVLALDGIKSAAVNLMLGKLSAEYDSQKLSAEKIAESVQKLGFGVTVDEEEKQATIREEQSEETGILLKRLKQSAVFSILLMLVSMLPESILPISTIANGFIQLLLLIPILFINRAYLTKGFKSLIKGSPDMNSLIMLGSAASLFYGLSVLLKNIFGDPALPKQTAYFFDSAGMILVIVTLGKYIEGRSKASATSAIEKLIKLAPDTAIIEIDGEEKEIAASALKPGDIIIVKAGSAVPIDGIVYEGNASMDQSAITGESIPVFKQKGDQIFSATTNVNGYIKVQAVNVGKDTALAKIIDLVENASYTKAPIGRLADKISGIFVPIVLLLALITFTTWLLKSVPFDIALMRAVAVLLVSCPCAMGLATPVATMYGTSKAAFSGILIKSAQDLESLAHAETVILDKTGTITEGKPAVTDIIVADNTYNQDSFLALAASLEKLSGHPLASAVLNEAEKRSLKLEEAEDLKLWAGQGISGKIIGSEIIAGNKSYMDNSSVELGEYAQTAEKLAKEGKTPLFFAKENKLCGIIAVADPIKENSIKAVEMMKEMGLETIMLTGDSKITAEAIGKQVKTDKIIAEILPEGKEAEVRKHMKSGKTTVVIGDGINDAPALTAADVGIAVGAGSDIAIDSADIVLVKSDLGDAVTAIKIGKAVIKTIKQNLAWAFSYNFIMLPVAAGVFSSFGIELNPMLASALMAMSSITVVFNSARLKNSH